MVIAHDTHNDGIEPVPIKQNDDNTNAIISGDLYKYTPHRICDDGKVNILISRVYIELKFKKKM